MLKVVGIIIIVAVCIGVGVYMGLSLKERHKRLAAICLFIEEISDRIRTGQELSRIIETSGEKAGVYREGYETRVSHEGLNQQDIELAEEFFSKLGMGDTDSQIKRCEVYVGLLKKQEIAAREQASAKSDLYGKIGIFAGLFIAILLI